MERFRSPEALIKNVAVDYTYPQNLPADDWALQGKWAINAEKITAMSANASVKLHFHAAKVFAVMGAPIKTPIKVIYKNNTHLLTVKNNELYNILNLKAEHDEVVELISPIPGLEIYTFTFGGASVNK